MKVAQVVGLAAAVVAWCGRTALGDEFEEQVVVDDDAVFDDLKLSNPLEEGREFMAEYAQGEDVVELESGVMYRVIESSSSPTAKSPKIDSMCKVEYSGKLVNGDEFDSSYARGEASVFELSRMIKGWQEVVPLMAEGDHWEVVVPSQLAYGSRGAGGKIPGNSVLVFRIHLLEVDPKFEGIEGIKQFVMREIPGLPFKLQIWQAIVLVLYMCLRFYLRSAFGEIGAQARQRRENQPAASAETGGPKTSGKGKAPEPKKTK